MEIRIMTALRDIGPKKVDSTTITIKLIYHTKWGQLQYATILDSLLGYL